MAQCVKAQSGAHTVSASVVVVVVVFQVCFFVFVFYS